MIPVMNVSRQYASLQNELDSVVLDVLHSGNYILGDTVARFEKDFAEYCGVKYAVGVANGTDALIIALEACGIGVGDEVIVPDMTFVATVEAVVQVGATPVLVDIDADTFTIDVNKIETAVSEKTKAIIPVHIYGQMADMDSINSIAKKYSLKVIEDCAQAAGAKYKGHRAGSLGDVGCVSFFPTKNLGAAGDGGMILTSDEGIYKICQALRVHGSGINGAYAKSVKENTSFDEGSIDFHGNLPKYYNYVIGHNSRLDALQAAILSVKLKQLDSWNEKRRQIARKYDEEILNKNIKKIVVADGNEHIYYVYPVKVVHREHFRNYMKDNDIATGVYFPVPMHKQECFSYLECKQDDFSTTEDWANHMVTIPMFPELTEAEISHIIQVVNNYKM